MPILRYAVLEALRFNKESRCLGLVIVTHSERGGIAPLESRRRFRRKERVVRSQVEWSDADDEETYTRRGERALGDS
jgi:hypothetical protein